MNKGFFVITNAGWELLAKLGAGVKFTPTRVVVGSGQPPESADPAVFTDLIAPIALATSTEPIVKGRTVSMVIEYRSDLNGGLESAIWIYEYGIFVQDPDKGEILFAYATLGDFPQHVRPYEDGIIDVRRFPISFVLIEGSDVELGYVPNAFMTAEDTAEYVTVVALPMILQEAQKLIDQHNVNETAHQDIRNIADLLASRVGRIEDMMLNDVTGNPYIIDFADLEGLNVEGVWNKAQQRIEF